MLIPLVLGLVAVLIIFYLVKLNAAMNGIPPEAAALSSKRWTEEEMKQAYVRVKEHPVDFNPHIPPKIERRYVVVGGSGLVGGQIIIHLLARGQTPESIRLLDFRRPQREDMQQPPVTEVDFVQTDVTKSDSVAAAFSKPWPSSVADLPLTVFHTAAIIRPHERSKLLYYRCSRVNVDGTKNVLHAAKAAGCDIFVATSSASISVYPVNYWIPVWKYWPERYCQVYDESDANEPLRDHYGYFANYAVSKAAAERFVMGEGKNDGAFRTGCIRPANGVYGNKYDQTIGTYLDAEDVPTFMPHGIQNFVHAAHVSIAHLNYEAALLSPHWAQLTGRTFVVTDPNPPVTFNDLFNLIGTLAVTPIRVQPLPPLPVLFFAYLIEAYILAVVRFPALQRLGLREPTGDISFLQPALFSICTHLVASDAAARKPVEEGGLGYKPVYTTLELMADEIRVWNEEHTADGPADGAKRRRDSTAAKLRQEMRNLGAALGSVKV